MNLETEPLYSSLGTDPDLGEIVDLFVDEMPNRISTILDCLKASDWEGLRCTAHQLKGAAGSYGFHSITPSAAAVEDSVREGQPEAAIRQAVDELVDLCGRVRSGAPV